MFKSTQRTNVTVDDRRTVIVLAKARKATDVAKVPHEVFLRQTLKARMGFGTKDPAPDSIKQAARDMAAAILRDAKAATLVTGTAAPKGWDKVEGGVEATA